MKNKDKIRASAIGLFNELGFVNVRLQHISDDTIISVGNIAYHYKNKEAIVSAIFSELEARQKEVLLAYRHTPIFENMDRIFSSFEDLQNTYSFFFTDTLEIKRAYPELFQKFNQFFSWQVLLFEEIIRFNVARGAIGKFPEQEDIKNLAFLMTQSINSWKLLEFTWKNEETSFQKSLASYAWNILKAYMTAEGLKELKVLQEKKVLFSTFEEEHESRT